MTRFLQPEFFWLFTLLPLVMLWRGRKGPVAAIEYSDVSLARDVARRSRSRIGNFLWLLPILAGALMQPQKAREFSIAVSDIVRVYIEQRFNATATHRTTEEFLHDLLDSSNTTLAKHRVLLSDFLQQCDLVKFAGMSLTTRNMESLHHSAEAFVQETAKPDEPPADPTQPIAAPPAGSAPRPKAPTAP